MSATQLLCQIIGVNPRKFSKEENILLEAEFFTRLCEELENFFRGQYKNYFRLIKEKTNKESEMGEDNLVYCVVKDILSTKEYTLAGIAYYTKLPEDVIYEAALGSNKAPSATLLRKIIELHRSVRPELYREIMEKVTMEYLLINKNTKEACDD